MTARELPRAADVLVELREVVASEPARRGRPGVALWGASARLGAGLHAVEGTRAGGLWLLGALLSGARAPSGGAVRVDGRDPARDAELRGRLGVLGPVGELPFGRTVGHAVRAALAARGADRESFDAVLDPLGLGPLHARSPATLRSAEARAVELALALATPSPVAVVVHEPLLDVAAPTARVLERLELLAQTGTCVIALVDPTSPPLPWTSRRRLRAGRLEEAALASPDAGVLVLSVVGASGARRLAAELLELEDASHVSVEVGPDDTAEVRVGAGDLARASRALLLGARSHELSVRSLDVVSGAEERS